MASVAVDIAERAHRHPNEWQIETIAGSVFSVVNVLRRYYPWLRVKTRAVHGQIHVKYDTSYIGSVEVQGEPQPRYHIPEWSIRACGCGYDDCPVCNPCGHHYRNPPVGMYHCPHCGSTYCVRHDHRDPTQLDQDKTWNGSPIENMTQSHLENTINYIAREHNRTSLNSKLVKRMYRVLNAKRVLNIDKEG